MSTYTDVMSGKKDNNINLNDLCYLLKKLGFVVRIKGSHHFFVKPGVTDPVNLQPDGAKALAYQVRQVRAVFKHYNISEA